MVGIDSVQKVLASLRDTGKHQDIVDGYFGLVMENFQCEEKMYTAVETAAGSK